MKKLSSFPLSLSLSPLYGHVPEDTEEARWAAVRHRERGSCPAIRARDLVPGAQWEGPTQAATATTSQPVTRVPVG